ncbi:MAG: hypothetical protein ACI8T1_000848 [Verrucomicrobiales bacterium]|jgi:hypothetical protein
MVLAAAYRESAGSEVVMTSVWIAVHIDHVGLWPLLVFRVRSH